MAKYLSAHGFHFQLVNHRNNYPYVKINIPYDYSFLDFIEIIKMYTMYNGNYDYDFYFSYYQLHLSSRYGKDEFDNIKISEYLSVSPKTICSYGPMKIEISTPRGYIKKMTKVYPVAIEAVGKFPDEDKMKEGIFSRYKKITPEKLTEYLKKHYYKIVDINSSPQNIKLKEDALKSFNERLKEHFKSKYRISDETYMYENETLGNKLVKI